MDEFNLKNPSEVAEMMLNEVRQWVKRTGRDWNECVTDNWREYVKANL